MSRLQTVVVRHVLAVLVCLCAFPERSLAADSSVDALLDDFHHAASEADADRYFGHFAPEAVFIGTDAHERWSVDEFRAFADPYFSSGRGWTYRVVTRNVSYSEDGRVAWFDEMLDNDSYGTCRGTGVLVKSDFGWKIAQYHLTIPIPNDIAEEVVRMIREYSAEN